MINLHPNSDIIWNDFFEKSYYENIISNIEKILPSFFDKYFLEVYLHKIDDKKNITCSNNNTQLIKILFICCDENNLITERNVKGYNFVFKTYLKEKNNSFIPLPIGYNDNTPLISPFQKANNRAFNFFFSGNLNEHRILGIYKAFHFLSFIPNKIFKILINRPRLQKILLITFPKKIINKNQYIKFNEGFNTGLAPIEYAKILNNSKIALCPKGFTSNETFRHYEALRQGCVIVTEPLPDHDFYRNHPFILTKNWKNLNKVSKNIDIENLQKQCINFYNENLSEIAVANYIIRKINYEI